jgi:protein-disulfide isomerase
MSSKRVTTSVITASAVALISAVVIAQAHVGASTNVTPTNFKDTSLLKPPPGTKVAVIEWEDLECPACANAFPIVHAAVAQAHVPLSERDYLIPGHIWSPMAAMYARYIQKKVSPKLAVDYRRQVFASQSRLFSKDDLQRFTGEFFRSNGIQMPFFADPSGELQREIDADIALGRRVGLAHTPTIVVVTPTHWIEVLDPAQIATVIAQSTQATDRR